MRKNITRCAFLVASIGQMLLSCDQKTRTLFELLPPEKTGITFNNLIQENDTFNILTHEYIYNGGGVGIADFNNDGRQDVFFSGNLVPNRLYLNKGDFHFEDVTETAKVNVPGRWNSGVAVADINRDGWMDIYVCATMHPDPANRKNMLFINKGPDENGIPTFADHAREYNLEHGGYSVTAAFFDYDKDEDLDLYLLINQRMDNVPSNYRKKITDGSAQNNDRLFRNNNDGTFTDVTLKAGITLEGFGLGLAIADLNVDGWPDIYVSNDYLSNDILYLNNKDGSFSNRIAEFIGHQSQFSMGNDAADFNNDALPDIITTDMLPETNDRKKTTIGNKSYLTYIQNEQYKYEYQYVRNMLHLNNGLNAGIKFSEIGQLAGVHQTEWSWSPLFADFDNDGFKDLVVTNGFPKDVTDKDFANYRSMVGNIASLALLKDSIPVVNVPNYIFKNNGDLTFSDKTREWGLDHPSFSNGAAFADFDNDGDLDYVINNINSQASVYRNTLYESSTQKDSQPNYLRIKLVDASGRKTSVGAKVKVYTGGTVQYFENNVYRGFLSSVEGIVHFGLGSANTVDSLVIQWIDGNIQKLINPKINQLLSVEYQATPVRIFTSNGTIPRPTTLVKSKESGFSYKHEEDDKIDFNLQRTLPHKFTQSGPGLAVGDIDGDSLEDLVIGGATGYSFSIFIQRNNGTFEAKQKTVRNEHKSEEDEGLLLFDADGDSDQDLYIVSGSTEHFQSQDPYQDRLLLNDGKGNFSKAVEALPDTRASGSCVRAADFDGDGDLDLFVGGRVVPGQYPTAPESYVLRNENGKFVNATDEVAADLKTVGMVTDAVWTDFNGDYRTDLILAGEFMPVRFFENTGGNLTPVKTDLDNQKGWWNSIAAADFDLDGDTDYVVGNLGYNSSYHVSEKYPLKVYANDFDGNGSMDAIMACYVRESMKSEERKLFPVHFWDELNSQSPKFRNKFSRYRQYATATIDDLLDKEERSAALILEANRMASVYIENLGDNQFSMKDLPVVAQTSPINGIVTEDVNGDSYPDVIMVGNDYGNEVFTGRYDACNGLVLLGDGQGNFSPQSPAQSGFYVPGDAKALVKISGRHSDLFVASCNRDSLQVFGLRAEASRKVFNPQALDAKAVFLRPDGRKQTIEFYLGSGYLSQSSRRVVIPSDVQEVIIYDSRGQHRTVRPNPYP